MVKRFTFDAAGVKRIAKAVRKVERSPSVLPAIPQNQNATNDEPFLWAKITGNDVAAELEGGEAIKYSWTQQIPDDGGWTNGSIGGVENACEQNNILTPDNTIVRLWSIGFDDEDEQRWMFSIGSTIRLKGKAEETIADGGSGTVGIWQWDSSGEVYEDTTLDVLSWNDWIDGGEDVASGNEVVIEYDIYGRRWNIVSAECA